MMRRHGAQQADAPANGRSDDIVAAPGIDLGEREQLETREREAL